MLNLMAVSSLGENGMPLYLHVVIRILRELRIEQQRTGGSFNYGRFKSMIDREALQQGQLGPLQQRLETLQSFMVQQQALSYQMSANKRQDGSSGVKGKTKVTARAGSGTNVGTTWKPQVN